MDEIEEELYRYLNGKTIIKSELLDDDGTIKLYFEDGTWIYFSAAGEQLNWVCTVEIDV